MFFDPAGFTYCRLLEESWRTIVEEFRRVPADQLLPWPGKSLCEVGWDSLGLYALGYRLDKNCRLCPRTAAIVESIPEMVSAGFSLLRAGARINPHVGYTGNVYRCHLGLDVPADCAIRVGDETRTWQDGKCLVLDDTVLHSAWNASNRDRLILLMDMLKPGAELDCDLPPHILSALRPLMDGDSGRRRAGHQSAVTPPPHFAPSHKEFSFDTSR